MDRLLNLAESCRIMGISYSKGQKLAKAGALPFKKLGSTWVISQSSLLRELGMEQEDGRKEADYAR